MKAAITLFFLLLGASAHEIVNVYSGMESKKAIEALGAICIDVTGQGTSTYLNEKGEIIWEKMSGLEYSSGNCQISVIYQKKGDVVVVKNFAECREAE